MRIRDKIYKWAMPKGSKLVSASSSQQWNTYSCGAHAYAAIVSHLCDRNVTYEEAAKAVKLTRGGAYDDDIIEGLEAAGVEVRPIEIDGDTFDEELSKDRLILTDRPTLIPMGDCTHAVVIGGYTPDFYLVLDSTLGIYPRAWESVINGATAAWSCGKRV